MSRSNRLELIRKIEAERGSRLLVYFTGDRKGLETRIATDSFPFLLNHLSRMGKQERIDLYLYSTGGLTNAGYALANLVREFCEHFGVIIPFKALSTATLIALAADDIIMTKMGLLSPIDPSIISPLGPQVAVPGQPGVTQPSPISVEDVIGYLDLARNELLLKDEESLVRVFDRLSQNVNPLALGAVNRVKEQISFLSRVLLSAHIENKNKIDKIIETLTKGRFSHDYLIGRKEAKEVIGLNIIDVDKKLDDYILSLYNEYDRLLELSTPYYPEAVLSGEKKIKKQFDRAIIESDDKTFVFRTVKEIEKVDVNLPPIQGTSIGYKETIISESWVEDDNI
ncbi:MAG: serine protease [Nitrososphaerota archaeon]